MELLLLIIIFAAVAAFTNRDNDVEENDDGDIGAMDIRNMNDVKGQAFWDNDKGI